MWENECTAPFIFISAAGGNEWLALSTDRFFPIERGGEGAFSLNISLNGPKNNAGHFGDEKFLLFLSGIERRYLDRPSYKKAIQNFSYSTRHFPSNSCGRHVMIGRGLAGCNVILFSVLS